MPKKPFNLDAWVDSGRALMARPRMPNGQTAYQDDINTIAYAVFTEGNPTAVTSGTLDPLDVMRLEGDEETEGWAADTIGATFIWPAPGSLWGAAAAIRRIVVTCTPLDTDIPAFKMTWRSTAYAVSG